MAGGNPYQNVTLWAEDVEITLLGSKQTALRLGGFEFAVPRAKLAAFNRRLTEALESAPTADVIQFAENPKPRGRTR